MTSHSTPPLLQMQAVDKSFPGVRALRDVSLDLHAGEVHALLGENGAGKSTLIKVLGGAHAPDAGRIVIEGREVRIRTPLDSRRAGVGVIYQELNLVPALSARENIFLGQEPHRAGFVPRSEERRKATALFERIGVRIDPEILCRDLSVAQRRGSTKPSPRHDRLSHRALAGRYRRHPFQLGARRPRRGVSGQTAKRRVEILLPRDARPEAPR